MSCSSGHSGTVHHRARLKPIDMTAAAARNHPAARLAGYQISGDESVLGVLKPYTLLGGTLPRIVGTASTRMTQGHDEADHEFGHVQKANPMMYMPVPVADERHRPTKMSLPRRLCRRPKGPGSVREKRRQREDREPAPDDERRNGHREVARRRARPSTARTTSSRHRPPRRSRTGLLISSIRTATIAPARRPAWRLRCSRCRCCAARRSA